MIIDHERGEVYVLRARCPGGTAVEADLPPYADRSAATRAAKMLGFHLTPGGPSELGAPEAVADLRDTIRSLGFDPIDCTIEVAARSAYGRNGWEGVYFHPVWPEPPPTRVVSAAEIRRAAADAAGGEFGF